MAKKSDKLTDTGKGEKNFFRGQHRNSKDFWNRVDAASNNANKAASMADAYYGDKAEKIAADEFRGAYQGDWPEEADTRDTAAGAKRLKDRVLKDSAEGRKKLVEKYAKEAPKKMAKGGTASKRADGCATKGKTKGRFV